MTPRTVVVLPGWYPTADRPLNGPFIRDHVRAAAAFGHRMVVVVDEGPGQTRGLYELREERDGEILELHFRYRRGAGRIVQIPALLALARRHRVDLIHAHIHRMAWPAAIVSALLRRPFLVSENSSEWPRSLITPGALRRARISFPRAALVCPVNRRLQETIESYGVHGRFRVVPNTVDAKLFHPPARFDGPPARIVNVARHVEVKALDVLLRAFARVATRRPELRLELIGDGPLTPSLRALADELGLAGRVEFSGEKRPAEIAQRLRASHVFALSSQSENMPLSVLEALCSGLPVVATDVGGISEAVGDDGALAPAGDPEALAAALERVVAGYETFDRAGIAGRAADRYSLEAVGATWDEIYRSL